eukprot:7958054-Alexandrium_andersonii.AAC.1
MGLEGTCSQTCRLVCSLGRPTQVLFSRWSGNPFEDLCPCLARAVRKPMHWKDPQVVPTVEQVGAHLAKASLNEVW